LKSKTLTCITAVTLFAALAVPLRLAAQDAGVGKQEHHHYKLIDTGTLGGATSSLGFEGERDINSRGTVMSLAETTIPDPYAPNCFFPDCFVYHAVDWRDDTLTDLGALPSVNNSGPTWISDSGLVSGFSENGLIDPLTGFPEFHAVLFKNGRVHDLGTLGGNESVAYSVNDRGRAVGCAANATSDPFGFCGIFAGVPQQSRAFIWQDGAMKDLGTLGGPDALAGLVNDRGQVAGWSLTDSTVNPTTGIPTQHPFLWENGKMRDLGTIGGTAVYLINHLNNRGQIVGGMNVAGDQSYHPFLWDGFSLRDLGTFGGDLGSADWINEAGDVVGWALKVGNQVSQAFLWRKGVLTDLGTVDGDPSSTAFVVNAQRQVVGATQDVNFNYVHAFLWERGSIADLNALIPDASGVQLLAAVGLNDRGEIVAQGVLSNGDLHAFLLIPCDENHPGVEGCDYDTAEAPTAVTKPETTDIGNAIRQAPRQGLRTHPHIPASSGNDSKPIGRSPVSADDDGKADYLKDRLDGFALSGVGRARRCTPRGMQCPPQFPPCCPGLVCVPASTRAYCEPK
jgi:probable HAF family extracellular repeat protein